MAQKDVSEDFSERIANNINDTFYAQGVSWEGKIKNLRTYAEIIVRFILGDENCYLTLGSTDIQNRLKQISTESAFLLSAVNKINSFGNDNIHTYKTSVATEQDFNEVLDVVYDLYAFLFIDYFTKNGVDTRNRVLGIFSLLPPIIRKKTFAYLWNKDKNNITIVDKLCLAVLKADGKDAALDWISNNESVLKSLPCRTKEASDGLIQKMGIELASKIFEQEPQNMYEVCTDKVNGLSQSIDKYGALYTTHEEALRFYEEKMSSQYQNLNADEEEFVTLMDFCFKGRKVVDNGKNELFYSVGNVRGVIQ